MQPHRLQARISHFQLSLPFLHRQYNMLEKLGTYKKKENNIYDWTFPYENWGAVQNALGGSVLEHDREHLMRDILPHCDPLIQEITVELHRTGKGSITIMVEGEGYLVKWFQSGEEKQFLVARSFVELVWNDVIRAYPVGVPIKSREVGEAIISALGNTHFNYPIMLHDDEDRYMQRCVKVGKWNHARSQKFDWSKFFGSRSDYHRYFYLPIKCLVAFGWIEHQKDGHIVRWHKADSFDKNARLEEIIMIEKAMDAEALRPEKPDNILSWAEAMK